LVKSILTGVRLETNQEFNVLYRVFEDNVRTLALANKGLIPDERILDGF